MLNWRRASMLRILSAGGLEIDWFVATPNSSSYAAWQPLVESLKPVRVMLLNSEYRFDTEAKATDGWGVRTEANGRVAFNLARYPYFGGRYRDKNPLRVVTVLIQQYHRFPLARRLMMAPLVISGASPLVLLTR